MELCYDGALVLPSSYAVMDEEEMCSIVTHIHICVPPFLFVLFCHSRLQTVLTLCKAFTYKN